MTELSTPGKNESQTDEEEINQLTKSTIVLGLIIGGFAGFAGGIVRFFVSDLYYFGILTACIFLPVLSPLTGLIGVAIAYPFGKFKEDKKLFIRLSAVFGFLTGFLPFSYWFSY